MRIDHKDSYKDFGEQFVVDSNINDYWGSVKMLKDIVKPFCLSSIKNKIIMEVGIGSGRIIRNLIRFSPKKIFAVEPSQAIKVAKKNNKNNSLKIKYLNVKAEDLELNNKVDFAFSLGVIHHIPQYKLACKKIFNSIKKGGKFVIWVYGYEGNELYIIIFNNLRRITRIMPDPFLRMLCTFLNYCCSAYIFLCKYLNLPMKSYMTKVFNKCSFEKRNYIIFDQLNPSYSKYFKKEELQALLKDVGFKKLIIKHRHGYSWLAIAEK